MDTLRGIFPQRQPRSKRDFLKENITKIGIMQKRKAKETFFANNINKPHTNRGNSGLYKNKTAASTMELNSMKLPVESMRKSFSQISVHDSKRDFAVQTTDVNDEYFLKDSIIRYPSATPLRPSNSSTRNHHNHHQQTCSRMHRMGLDPKVPSKTSYSSNSCNLPGKKSLRKDQPASILKGSTAVHKSNENFSYESQKVENENVDQTPILISDDEDDSKKKEVPLSEKESNENDEKIRAAKEDPECPEGHVPLSESERENSLKLAQKQFKDLVDELNRLPMTCETLRVRNRKIHIEKELRKLEANIRVFSRKTVYVKLQ